MSSIGDVNIAKLTCNLHWPDGQEKNGLPGWGCSLNPSYQSVGLVCQVNTLN